MTPPRISSQFAPRKNIHLIGLLGNFSGHKISYEERIARLGPPKFL